ncbi:MAG: hypothetical protein GF320_04240 [Armatimonadia bacterium]|nr:hypothetical protein [Armatimonadia bacterium]
MTLDECRRILELEGRLEVADLKRAKRRLLILYHPDQNPQRRQWADERTRRVLLAYDLLMAHLGSGGAAPSLQPGRRARGGGFATVSERGPKPTRPRPREPEHRDLSYLLVRASGQLLGLPLASVVQVMPLSAESVQATGVAKGLGWAGTLLYRQDRIPLVDLGVVMGLDAEDLEECKHYVVVRSGSGSVAVAVEEVSELVTVNATAIEPAEAVFAGLGSHTKGFFRYEQTYAVIPDLEALLG